MIGLVTKKEAERIAQEAAEEAVYKFSRHLKAQYGVYVRQYEECDKYRTPVLTEDEAHHIASDKVDEFANALGYTKQIKQSVAAKVVYVKKTGRK